MNTTTLATIATVISVILTAVGGFIKVIRDARKASSDAAANASRDLLKGMRDELEDVRKRVRTLEQQDETRRKQLNLVIADRDDLAHYLHRVMRWIQDGYTPPPPPIPQHLSAAFAAAGVPWPGDETTDTTSERTTS